MLPLYEAKMIHHYDTRWATYESDGSTRLMSAGEKAAHFSPMPRYWVPDLAVEKAFSVTGTETGAFFAWRGIARTTDARTAIGTVVPGLPGGGNFDFVVGLRHDDALYFAAAFSSFVFDFCVRQKLSNMHLQFSVAKQLPLPAPPSWLVPPRLWRSGWVARHVERLNGWPRSAEVRDGLRADLDALMLHVYGVSRADAAYILETFPIVKAKDVKEFGEFRTKRLVLEAYDDMAEAIKAGVLYRSPYESEVSA